MTSYTIIDGLGQEITTGMRSEDRAFALAQEHADRDGLAVQVVASDGDEWTVEPSRPAFSTIEPVLQDAQIRELRREAEDAGDTRQAMICVLALGGELSPCDPGTDAADLIEEGMTQADARAECARVIAEARAQHA